MRANVSTRRIGINFNKEGLAEARIWSPNANSVEIVIPGEKISCSKEEYGYWFASSEQIKPGTEYLVSVDGKKPLPDPASLFQPNGVHDVSRAINLGSFEWTDSGWKNFPLGSYIIYELHTGTFSHQQNFDGIISKLDYLVDLGVNAIEIMPVGQFPGSRNWGYDGVYPFAVQNSYGGPHKLQELVNACHAKGIAVVLDVIYNHLGPEGNYLNEFGPYFTDKYNTPWGKALNFDDAWCDGVRHYFIENALMWFRDFHIDALRMDATHAIKDFSPVHIMKEIRQHVDKLSEMTGKPHYLIAEMDLNDPVFINPVSEGGYGADAQWIDEFHHALRVSSGQAREGYYADFDGVEHLAKSYNDAYVFDGQFSPHRKKIFGAKTNNPGHQFVVFSQNHDHVGNRMLGERTSTLVSTGMCRLLAGAVMVAPYVPMLFMGEEWAETNPFFFFISHTDEKLAALVNKGLKEEFSSFNWSAEPPDPRLVETFGRSMLNWKWQDVREQQQMFDWYRKLINVRKTNPAVGSTDRAGTTARADRENKIVVVEKSAGSQDAYCILNFSTSEQKVNLPGEGWQLILDSASYESESSSADRKENGIVCAESIHIYTRNRK